MSVCDQWVFWEAVDINGTYLLNQELPTNDLMQGIQFRLLQLDHGGGRCRCWKLTQLEFKTATSTSLIQIVSGNETFDDSKVCHSEHQDGGIFCSANAYEARGFVTIAVPFPGSQGVQNCPDYSLLSDVQPAFPENCDTTSPRM